MKETYFAATIALFGAFGCNEEPTQRTQPTSTVHPTSAPKVLVSTVPGDVMTDIGITPLNVFLDFNGQPVPDPVLQAVASAVEFRTFPELDPVPASITASPSTPYNEGHEPTQAFPARATIDVLPSAPLADRWYLLSVSAIPADCTVVADTPGPAELGALAARFHPATEPVLRKASFCKNKVDTIVVLEFSENIVIDPSVSSKMQVAAAGSTCPMVASPAKSDTTFYFDCTASAWAGQVVEVTIQPTLNGASGEAVKVFDSKAASMAEVSQTKLFNQALDFSKSQEISYCKTWRP